MDKPTFHSNSIYKQSRNTAKDEQKMTVKTFPKNKEMNVLAQGIEYFLFVST
jgi:hypothetical protein